MRKVHIGIVILLLLNGCVQNTKVVSPIDTKKANNIDVTVDNSEKIKQQYTLDKGTYVVSEDKFPTKVSKAFEKIPNFQKNDFKELKTAEKKEFKKNIIVQGKSVKVNVESIPLNQFIDFVFSSVLKVNYTTDKNVKDLKQPISLNMSQPLPKQQLFNVVEKILKEESVVLVKENGTIFIKAVASKIVQNDLSDRYIVFGRELSSSITDNKKVIMFVPYYFMNPKSSFNILRKLGVNNVRFRYLDNNIQILEGEASHVRQTLQMINIIDTPSMENKTPYLIELENIEVQNFKERIETILKNNAIPIASSIKDIGIVLNPIEELNALLVLTPKKSWLEMLLFWKNKLDTISDLAVSDKPQLYMYKVKHRKADEFAVILQNVLPQNTLQNVTVTNGNTVANSTGESNTRVASPTPNMLSQRISPTQISIKSDLHTNSLIMHLTSAQYKQILPIIKKLDKLPLEVLVEVTLAEVDISNNFNLGFEWSLLNNKALRGVTQTQVSGAHTATLGGQAGLTSSLFTTNLTSVINAFAEDDVLDILSRPSLLILNNQTGNINVGQQVPVVSSEVSGTDINTGNTNTPSVLRNISYTNTGITVNLTPTINSNGTLTLAINIVLSEAQSNQTSSIDSPLIVNRSLSTSVVMSSGQSVLLGGLISHSLSNGNSGVPVLKDLPIIGDLFKSKSQAHRKTELIILLHPKIIKNSLELTEETKKFKILLKNLKSL